LHTKVDTRIEGSAGRLLPSVLVGGDELTDRVWAVVEPLLPPVPGGGSGGSPAGDLRDPVEAAYRRAVA
jgi:hypothetical protein